MTDDDDVIDRAAGLQPGHRVHQARRFRAKVVEATQASHDALLDLPVAGLTRADRLRVALHVCEVSQATALAAHYRKRLQALENEERPQGPAGEAGSPVPDDGANPSRRPALLDYATLLTLDPRAGDRAALQRLAEAGLDDAAIVALAQLIAFLAYQTRVVAGLAALRASRGAAASPTPSAEPGVVAPAAGAAPLRLIRRNGYTNEPLGWRSWLQPLQLAEATPLQLEVLDASHAQARESDYYLTLAHQPTMLRHRSSAYNAIMYAPGGLPRAERELAAMVVSVTNGCVYCTSVHAQRHVQLARRDAVVEQVFDDPASAGTDARERALVQFARRLTLAPATLDKDAIDALHDVGLDDREVIDLLHASAIFGWANRLMHNLGEPVQPPGAG